MIFLDTETCGFHGPIVTIQWAKDDGEIITHHVWTRPIDETMSLIEDITNDVVCGFNLVFDWFHICQLYTTLHLLREKVGGHQWPEFFINEYAMCEYEARLLDMCLKPRGALDLMLYARKTKYQATMGRKPIKVKKIPNVLAEQLVKELDARVKLPDIFFKKRKDKDVRWYIEPIKDKGYEDFCNIVLSFAPSTSLKALAVDALGYRDVDTMEDLGAPYTPKEYGYAPYAMAHKDDAGWAKSWPECIDLHIKYWETDERAKKYATNDVKYTRELYEYFGKPEHSDQESILACSVGAARWRVLSVDTDKIKELKRRNQVVVDSTKNKFLYSTPDSCIAYLSQCVSAFEKHAMRKKDSEDEDDLSSARPILEFLSRQRVAEVCPLCNGFGCDKCKSGLVETEERTEAAIRAKEILDTRQSAQVIALCDKLLLAGGLHASFDVIGAKSNRMAGADGLNTQGINHSRDIRECFTLAQWSKILVGGDFESFEVYIADAVYQDPELHKLLMEGKKIHGLFGMSLFSKTYEQIMADKELYSKSKQAVFALLYGGDEGTLERKLNIDPEIAFQAYKDWCARFIKWGEARERIKNRFGAICQPKGLGTKVEWKDPDDYIESLYGFRRYFTIENQIIRALFELAEKPPVEWTKVKVKVVRRADRGEQSASGAVRSAIIGAAFGIQSSVIRAAANHEIQSTGAHITKAMQVSIWNLQPFGVSKWKVQLLQVHDELLCVTDKETAPSIRTCVDNFITEYRKKIPLLAIGWKENIKSWAEK